MLGFGPCDGKYLNDVIKTLKDNPDSNYEIYDNTEALNKAYPALRAPQGYFGHTDKVAGILRADKCLDATLVGLILNIYFTIYICWHRPPLWYMAT